MLKRVLSKKQITEQMQVNTIGLVNPDNLKETETTLEAIAEFIKNNSSEEVCIRSGLAVANLKGYLSGGNSPRYPGDARSKQWMDIIHESLRGISESVMILNEVKGEAEEYIANLSEIGKTVTIRKQSSKDNLMSTEKAALGEVPQILDILVNQGILTKEQQQEIIGDKNNPEYKGLFFGEIALRKGFVEQEQVDTGLREQSKLIARAAVEDMQEIKSGRQFPAYLKPHWGNNGQVNAVSDPVTIDNAASAAANVAKLIVLLTKDNLASVNPDQVRGGVIAAKNLTSYILDGSSAQCPGNKKAADWLDESREVLGSAALAAGVDAVTINKYIENRFTEIGRGVYLTQARENNPTQQIRSI